VFVLLGGLIAMTLIDARTFMIPLSIPWFVTAAALLIHPIHAAVVGPLRGAGWTIPLPETPPAVWASLGGMLGVAACAVLLKVRVIPRSFADFDAWAAEAQRKEAEADAAASPDAPVITGGETALGPLLWRVFFFTGPAIALMAVGFAVGLRIGRVFECVLGGTALGLALGMFLRRFAPGAALDADSEPEWIRYPHARREATKEVLCLLCIGAFAALGWWIGGQATAAPPLWVRALAGASLGYLSGGALVWLVRILGSIGFGKEAMGMGDVHLLAAVGAVLGWLDPILAFFTAPFFGLAWVALAAAFARRKGVAMALPFGPHLAAATLAVIIAWPLYEWLLHAITPPTLATP